MNRAEEAYTITVSAIGPGPAIDHRIHHLLKIALRACGLRATAIIPASAVDADARDGGGMSHNTPDAPESRALASECSEKSERRRQNERFSPGKLLTDDYHGNRPYPQLFDLSYTNNREKSVKP